MGICCDKIVYARISKNKDLNVSSLISPRDKKTENKIEELQSLRESQNREILFQNRESQKPESENRESENRESQKPESQKPESQKEILTANDVNLMSPYLPNNNHRYLNHQKDKPKFPSDIKMSISIHNKSYSIDMIKNQSLNLSRIKSKSFEEEPFVLREDILYYLEEENKEKENNNS